MIEKRNMLVQKKSILFIFIIGLFICQSCLLFRPSAAKLTRRALEAHKQYDAIIVPGVPFIAPRWDMTMTMRVVWAVHLYNRGLTKKIIMSGSSVYSPYVEAEMMKLYAIKFGVPAEDIIVEDKAQHSTENIWYGYKLAKSLGYENIALATDPFQTRMTYRFGKKRLKPLKYLPVIFDTLRLLPQATPEIDYQPYEVKDFKSIVETQSKWYRLRGTMGKHIDFKK